MPPRADSENAEETVADRPPKREESRPKPEAAEPAAVATAGEPAADRTQVLANALDGAGTRGGADQTPTRGTLTGTSTVTSPLDALKRAEILGTRSFCRIGIAIAITGALAVMVLPGNRVATYLMLGTIITGTLSIAYLYHRTNDPMTFFDGNGVAIAWYIPSLGVCAAVPFFGPFSPVAVVLVLGIYFTALGKSPRLALAIYITSALVQGACGGLVIIDAIHPGFIRADYLPVYIQLICQGLVQVVFACTYLIARGHRRSSLIALGELESAVRAVAQREALLEEAREELRRAMGTGRGRFSEQMIGRYRLGEVIGRGAMGEVYEGIDTTTQEPVAVKMLSQASLGDPHHVQRFLRELQTAAGIKSPNVVRVIEVGEQPLPHMVMERLRGRDLATILRSGKRLMVHDRVVDMLRQVAAGVTAAGNAGIVHRDLKPQNLFLAGSTWKVLDFGVARQADQGDTLTAGHIIGTPAYMAPEQARGTKVDHRSDLYALAAIAYRALTGHPPFSGGEVVDLLYRVVHTAPVRPSLRCALPADVDHVLALGLAKDPAARFSTASELVESIAAALGGTLAESIRARGQAQSGTWAAEASLERRR